MDKFFKDLENAKIEQLNKIAPEKPAKFSVTKRCDGVVEIEYQGSPVDIANFVMMGIQNILQRDPEQGMIYANRLNKLLKSIYKRNPIIEQAIKLCDKYGANKGDE